MGMEALHCVIYYTVQLKSAALLPLGMKQNVNENTPDVCVVVFNTFVLCDQDSNTFWLCHVKILFSRKLQV